MKLAAALAIVVLAWAAIYLPGLGSHELKGEEARRVLPGRTMMQTGDWIVPRSAGKIYNRKPPGINWATAAAIKITGRMDEWTVRLPSVLGILVLALVIAAAMRDFLGKDGALLAALITLTNIGFIEKGRLAEIESLYCAMFGIAIVSWIAQWRSGRTLAAWSFSLLVLGIGFLVKGPPHVWYFYAIVIAVLRQQKKTRELLTWQHGLGLILFFSAWSWWAVMNSGHNPQKDSGAVWIEQITHRLGFVEFSFTNWLLQIPQSVVNFLPWALLLPLVWHIPKLSPRYPSPEPADASRQLMLDGLKKGLLVAFLVIAVLPSSRPRFMLPLNTVAAILLASAVCRCAPEFRRRVRSWVIAALFLASGVIGLYSFLIERGTIAKEELRPFAREIASLVGSPPNLVLFRTPERMWPFYLGMGCREIASADELPANVRWVLTPEKNRADNLEMLTRHYGQPLSEKRLKEPLTDNAGGKGIGLVLFEFATRR